jgi:hypothetical protein
MPGPQAGVIREFKKATPLMQMKRDFIDKYWDEFPLDEQRSRSLVQRARDAGIYSKGTQTLSIYMGLNNEYHRMKAKGRT